jgi:Flp pilus assembly protein protease CpaA
LPALSSGAFVVLAAGVTVATAIDLRTRRIPNALTAAMTGVGIAMAAVGAIVGPGLVVVAFLCTAIAGGVLAVAIAVQRRRFAATIAGTGRLIGASGRQQIETATASNRFAYGPAIAMGSVIATFVA